MRSEDDEAIVSAVASYPLHLRDPLTQLEVLKHYLLIRSGRTLGLSVLEQIEAHFQTTGSTYWPHDVEELIAERIQDPDEPLGVRRHLILVWAMSDDSQRRFRLFTVLEEISPEVFALPLGRAIYRSPPYDPPTDIVEFLGSRGPSAIDALPALIDALEHEDQWSFVPTVVLAIAAIGQRDVVGQLNALLGSDRPEIRDAAARGLALLTNN